MEKTVTVAIVELRQALLDVVNNSGLAPAITGMVLHELTRAVDDAAHQQYAKDMEDAAKKAEEVPTEVETL